MDIRAYELRLSATVMDEPNGASTCRYSITGFDDIPDDDLALILFTGAARNLQMFATMAGARNKNDLAHVMINIISELTEKVFTGFGEDSE